MRILTKHFSFLLLSCVTITYSKVVLADYSNPFVPVYSKGDDISRMAVKPAVIYNEVPNSKIEIPNMPAYKTQDDLGECRAFALGTLLQKHTCDKWKSDIPDCKNPPADSAISYFGVMVYTNQVSDKSKTLNIDNADGRNGIYDIAVNISKTGNKQILESCKPFDKVVNSFSTSGKDGLHKRDKFLTYLKNMYQSKKGETEANIADCPECLAEINQVAGLNADLNDLKKALTKKNYNEFIYSLFFNDCKMESFPSGFSTMMFPDDSINATAAEVKTKALEGLKKGKPVMLPTICLSKDAGVECSSLHSLVVSGYKKVCTGATANQCKELFKVHNSWGSDWQKANNDGWVDAESLLANINLVKDSAGKNRIGSASVLWLE